MPKIKWGLIGTGKTARQIATQLSTDQSDQVELAAVASRTLQKAYEFTAEFNIQKAYGTYEELAFDPEITVLYITTPSDSLYKTILMALKAGKHIFCEKLITLKKAQLDEVMALAKNNNLLVAEAMTIYHMPLYKELKRNIYAGEYGKLMMIQTQSGTHQIKESTNPFYIQTPGDGELFDIGVHAFSFIRYFISSQPQERHTSVSMSGTGIGKQGAFLFQNDQGVIATASLSIQADMPPFATIVCENAYITIPDYHEADEALITYSNGSTFTIRSGYRSKALTYGINAITHTLLSNDDFTSFSFTQDVNELVNWATKEWHTSWGITNDQ